LIELLTILLLGLITGILIGLFPVFPIYLSAFVIYFTAGVMTPEQMLLFWIVASIGSQFFGSVSAITLGIPGDASSLVYINDVQRLTLEQKQRLLWTTSRGSLISACMALCLVWLLYHVYVNFAVGFLSGVAVKVILLYAVILGVILLSPRRLPAAALAVFGILLAPQNNYSLPEVWYHISVTFQHTTFFMLVVALLIVPELGSFSLQSGNRQKFTARPDPLPRWQVFKNSVLGCVIGMVPGPAAETAAAAAYALNKNRSVTERVLAAETANNPGVIMMLLPLILLAIPFTASSMIMSNIMDGQMIDIPALAREASGLIPGFTVFDALIILAVVTVIFYYFMSTRFINVYTVMVAASQTHLRWLLILLCAAMIAMDMHIQEITALTYLSLLVFFCIVGYFAKYFRINTVALIFCFLLGDQIIWSTQQFYLIYFA